MAGNHDLILDASFVAAHPDRELDCKPRQRRRDLDWGGVRYLRHEAVEVKVGRSGRTVRAFGSPWTPRFGSWGFQYEGGEAEGVWSGKVPEGTEVLLVHGPPKGHLDDGGKGCEVLLREVWRVRPRMAVCGHVHAGRGWQWLGFDKAQELYERVVLGRGGWVSVVMLAWCVVWGLVVTTFGPWGNTNSAGRGRGTLLVNAAMVGGKGNTKRREAFVLVV